MNEKRLEILLNKYFDEALNESEKAELEFLLLSSPKARIFFWEQAHFHTLLRSHGMESWGGWLQANFRSPETPEKSGDQTDIARPSGWMDRIRRFLRSGPCIGWIPVAAMAILAFTILSLWMTREPSDLQTVETPVGEKRGIAELTYAVDAEWEDTDFQPRLGAVLYPGTLQLKRGLVEIQFYSGAQVAMEGPAVMEMVSDMEARFHKGKMRAEVPPPAQGFKISAPKVEVIDRGTSFAMEVDDRGTADVQVFQGKVELADPTRPQKVHTIQEGRRVLSAGEEGVREVPFGEKRFFSISDVEMRAQQEMQKRYQAWRQYSGRVQKDSSLLLYYNFEDQRKESRTVLNRGPKKKANSNGTMVGGQWVDGRWPGKGGMAFRQFGDRIRLALAHELDAMTCMAWVRLDNLDHFYNALMMSGDARVGEPQWQFNQNGSINFGKRTLAGWGVGHLEVLTSPVKLDPDQMGLWVHIAVVYDNPSKTLSHYVDGREISRHPLQSLTPIRLGRLEIGNWTPVSGQPMEPIRSFKGRIDEFAIYSRVLGAEEIRQAYNIGKVL